MSKRAKSERRLVEQEEFIRDMMRQNEWDESAEMLNLKKFTQYTRIVRRLILAANIAGQMLSYENLRAIMKRKLAIAELFGAPLGVISDPSFQSRNIISIADILKRRHDALRTVQRQAYPEEQEQGERCYSQICG